jgi:hypothetical protein
MPQSYSRNESYQYDLVHWDWNVVTGNLNSTSHTPTNGTFRSSNRTFAGSKNPNYRTFRSQNGYLPTLAASDLVITVEGNLVEQRQYRVINGKRLVTDERLIRDVLSSTAPPNIPASLTDEVWSKLRRKVLDQDFNAPVFLAEGNKTLRMVFESSTKIFKALKAFRRLDFPGVARHLGLKPGTWHNTWLEYKYGWLPLLNDIQGGAVHLAKLNFKRDQSTLRSRVSKVSQITYGSSILHKGTLEHRADAWVTVRIRTPSTQTANKLGLLNPSLVVWELVPFSFVADWFVNIGDCLAELTAFQGVQILDAGTGTTVNFAGTLKEVNNFPWDRQRTANFSYRKYNRANGAQTMPSLRIKSNPLDLSKLTTSFALIKQTLYGGPGKFRYR